MIDTIIVGSGFSGLTSYLLLKKYNPTVLALSKINHQKTLLKSRKKLKTNKLCSQKINSYGSLNFNLKSSIKLHDRLSMGGNSNIWGGFIDVSDLSKKFINICNQNSIKFEKLDFEKNGYKSNNEFIRQLRDSKDNILNSSYFFNDFINGYLYSFEVQNNKILLKYLNSKNTKINTLETKKLILAISFPQLIDLLFRSGYINENKTLVLTEFNHKFLNSFKKNLIVRKSDDCIIKYDFLRTLKHFIGYQSSLDNYKIPIPLYIDQVFSNQKKFLKLKLNLKLKCIENYDNITNFGSSIHYCNLLIDNVDIDTFLSKISKNIIGAGMPFVKQNKPGPISNDIVNNIFKKML